MSESLTDSHKFNLWKQNLETNGLTINGIEEIYTVNRGNGEVLFSLLKLDAHSPEGDKIPPICFLKGEVISILICLIDQESKEKFLLLVRQRRICNGGDLYETVAGMVDLNDDPLEVARREAEEESGIVLKLENIQPLNKEPYYVSTGTSDEAIYFFYVEKELDREAIFRYHDKKMGMISEHESIVTHIATIPEALQLIKNTSSLLNVHLYLAAIAQN